LTLTYEKLLDVTFGTDAEDPCQIAWYRTSMSEYQVITSASPPYSLFITNQPTNMTKQRA